MSVAFAASPAGQSVDGEPLALRGTIAGTGAYFPERVVRNRYFVEDLGLDTSESWIETKTGIRERRFATGETLDDMAAAAATQALLRAGADPSEVRLIVVATSSPERRMPSTAALVQARIGARCAAAFDLNAACAGFVYALDVAARCLQSLGGKALVIGADRGSALVDPCDRSTCVFFGDGAGAVLLNSDGDGAILCSQLATDGDAAPLTVPANGPMHMDGKAIWNFATRVLPETVLSLCRSAGIAPAELSLIVPHQANRNILHAAAEELGLPFERFVLNLDRFGNTVAASIPTALDEALRSGRGRRGDYVLLVGFGAGLCWGGQILRL